MCLSRGGCENVFDNHGDARNITMATIQNAANVAGIMVPEVLVNVQRGVTQALTGMTDWTGGQESPQMVLDDRRQPQISSASPTPPPTEQSPYS